MNWSIIYEILNFIFSPPCNKNHVINCKSIIYNLDDPIIDLNEFKITNFKISLKHLAPIVIKVHLPPATNTSSKR